MLRNTEGFVYEVAFSVRVRFEFLLALKALLVLGLEAFLVRNFFLGSLFSHFARAREDHYLRQLLLERLLALVRFRSDLRNLGLGVRGNARRRRHKLAVL